MSSGKISPISPHHFPKPSDLPPELWIRIAGFLSDRELFKLRLLNGCFYSLALDSRCRELSLLTKRRGLYNLDHGMFQWNRRLNYLNQIISIYSGRADTQRRVKKLSIIPNVEYYHWDFTFSNVYLSKFQTMLSIPVRPIASRLAKRGVSLTKYRARRLAQKICELIPQMDHIGSVDLIFISPHHCTSISPPSSCSYLDLLWRLHSERITELSVRLTWNSDVSLGGVPPEGTPFPNLRKFRLVHGCFCDHKNQNTRAILSSLCKTILLCSQLQDLRLATNLSHTLSILDLGCDRFPLLASLSLDTSNTSLTPDSADIAARSIQRFITHASSLSRLDLQLGPFVNFDMALPTTLSSLRIVLADESSFSNLLRRLQPCVHNIRTLEVLSGQRCEGAWNSILALMLQFLSEGAPQLQRLSVDVRNCQVSFFSDLAKTLPNLRSLQIMIYGELIFQGGRSFSYNYWDPEATSKEELNENFNALNLGETWKLQDIAISGLGRATNILLMRTVAERVPTIKSFQQRGDMDI